MGFFANATKSAAEKFLLRNAQTASVYDLAWAARLAALTGLRQGDLLKLSWNHISDLAIEIKTGKSRQHRVAVTPIYQALRDLLSAIPQRATTAALTTAVACLGEVSDRRGTRRSSEPVYRTADYIFTACGARLRRISIERILAAER